MLQCEHRNNAYALWNFDISKFQVLKLFKKLKVVFSLCLYIAFAPKTINIYKNLFTHKTIKYQSMFSRKKSCSGSCSSALGTGSQELC